MTVKSPARLAERPSSPRLKRTRSGGNRLSTSIYEEIRNRICLLVYPPESIIRESDLADEFGISRTPVRQVLQRLEIEGYVETRNGVGTIVTPIYIPTFRDVYAMRLKLAGLIGDMDPNACTSQMLEDMRKLLERAQQLYKVHDQQEFWDINLQRHAIILSLIGNSALRELYDGYYFKTSRVWYLVIDQIWENQVTALCNELSDLCQGLEFGNAKVVGNVEFNHLSYYLNLFENFAQDENRS